MESFGGKGRFVVKRYRRVFGRYAPFGLVEEKKY
jgi:hypothetical protein